MIVKAQQKPKKWPIIVAVIGIFILGGLLLFVLWARLLTDEDTWLCQNGQWVKHGNPSTPKPTLECRSTQNGADSASQQNNIQGMNIDPLKAADSAVNSLPDQNPVGPIQIKGFLGFIAPVADIAADFGTKVCRWGKIKESTKTCSSIKIEFQNFFDSISK